MMRLLVCGVVLLSSTLFGDCPGGNCPNGICRQRVFQRFSVQAPVVPMQVMVSPEVSVPVVVSEVTEVDPEGPQVGPAPQPFCPVTPSLDNRVRFQVVRERSYSCRVPRRQNFQQRMRVWRR